MLIRRHPHDASITYILANLPRDVGMVVVLPTPLCTSRSSISENTYLQAFPIDKHLSHWLASHVDILNLFRCYIFSLCQFKYVLFPVDNLQGAILFHRKKRDGILCTGSPVLTCNPTCACNPLVLCVHSSGDPEGIS